MCGRCRNEISCRSVISALVGQNECPAKRQHRDAETEIDLLAVSAKSNQYLVGECKFKGRPFSYGEYLDTCAKLTPQKDNADFFYYLFSESGFDEKTDGGSKGE